MDGRDIGEFKQEAEKKIDLKLKASEADIATPEILYQSLTALPGGRVVLVSSLAALERTTGITQIRHLERKRTITLQVTPPFSVPLEAAMETIETRVVPALKAQGMLERIDVGQSGVADKLTEARQTLQWDFVLAAVICYLLMAALFENFLYPFIILFTVPLAAVGGLLGLKMVNLFIAEQPLDILTMLGFVILVGVVVNNAILIVHQSLNNIRSYGMRHLDAVRESVRTRLRPIFMSAFTSVFGMLPLVLVPGPGSEFYRGLGSVVLGGLMVSTVFTIFVIPSLLLFIIGRERLRPMAEQMAGEEPYPE
jgi:HAE1 family hydrophobic/amphiphilic exporter-1